MKFKILYFIRENFIWKWYVYHFGIYVWVVSPTSTRNKLNERHIREMTYILSVVRFWVEMLDPNLFLKRLLRIQIQMWVISLTYPFQIFYFYLYKEWFCSLKMNNANESYIDKYRMSYKDMSHVARVKIRIITEE